MGGSRTSGSCGADDELNEVLVRGSEALNIEMTDELRAEFVRDAYGNVGLIQRL
jgi:hypothetical protein